MQNKFADMLALARENVRKNPIIFPVDTDTVTKKYVKCLLDEVEEVLPELKENNVVHLTDELSDVAWDFLTLMAILEHRGYIDNVEGVLEFGLEKYTERSQAFQEENNNLWDKIKSGQKANLKTKHEDRYGN